MIGIGMYEFDGPGLKATELKNESGIYALLHSTNDNTDSYELIDLDQSGSLEAWSKDIDFKVMSNQYPGSVSLAVHYTPGLARAARRSIVTEILQEFK